MLTLAFMGGVPAQLVPDNQKVGVDRANWYEPGLGVPEQGGRNMISSDPLPPGTVYSASVAADGTVGLFRIEVSLSTLSWPR
jgi:predicted ATP-dependent Lon-type protease